MGILCGVIGFPLMLVVLLVLQARRVTIYEMERLPEIQREVEQADLDDVNRALKARPTDQAFPRVLAFDAHGNLARYEERLK